VQYKEAKLEGDPGLYLMGARFYDPDVGRFISEDPLGLKAGINLYTFAGNDPVNGFDPTGAFTVNVFDLLEHVVVGRALVLAWRP